MTEKEIGIQEWMSFLRGYVMTGKVKIFNNVTKSYASPTDDINIRGQAELLTECEESGRGLDHLEFIDQIILE